MVLFAVRRIARSHAIVAGLGTGLLFFAALAHLALAGNPAASGPLLLLDRLFDVLLTFGLLWLSSGVGLGLLRLFRVPFDAQGERLLFAVALGMGALAYAALALALGGVLWRPLLWGLLFALMLISRRDLFAAFKLVRDGWRGLDAAIAAKRPPAWTLLVALVLAVIWLLSALPAVMPPTEADSMVYHLDAPRTFLEAGRLFQPPFRDRFYFPMTVELLYLIPMSLDSDIVPRLLHLASGVLLVAAVAVLAQQTYGGRAGLLSVPVVASIPMLGAIASWAYIDLTWCLFQTLTLVAVLHWWRGGSWRWLLLGGTLLGLALGSKYLALQAAIALGPIVLWGALRGRAPARGVTLAGLALGIPAVVVAFPWYAKNALLTGNPFHPFFGSLFRGGLNLAGAALDTQTMLQDNAAVGMGHGLIDYLLLPLNVYLHSTAFTYGHLPTVFSPLFLIIPLGLAAGAARPSIPLGMFAAILFGLWAVGVQEARYFLPGAMVLAAMTGGAFDALLKHFQGRPRFQGILLAALLLVTAMTAAGQAVREGPAWYQQDLAFLVGARSREAYLSERLLAYPALAWVNEQAPPDSRSMMVRDAGGYYLRRPNLPDDLLYPRWLLPGPEGYLYPERTDAGWRPAVAPTMDAALAAVREQGISVLVMSHIYLEGVGDRYRRGVEQQEADIKTAVEQGKLTVLHADQAFTVLGVPNGALRVAP